MMDEPVAEVSISSQTVNLSFSVSVRPGNPVLSPPITSCRRVPFPPSGAMAKGCQMLSPADASHSACAGDTLSVLRKQERQQTGHGLAPGCGGLLAGGCSSATAREKGCSSREILVVGSGAQLQSWAVTQHCALSLGHLSRTALAHCSCSAALSVFSTYPSFPGSALLAYVSKAPLEKACYMQSPASISLSFNE